MSRIKFIKNLMLLITLLVVSGVLINLYRQNQFGLWFLGSVTAFLILLSLLKKGTEQVSNHFNRYKASLPVRKRAFLDSVQHGFEILCLIMFGVVFAQFFQNDRFQAIVFLVILLMVSATEKYKQVIHDAGR